MTQPHTSRVMPNPSFLLFRATKFEMSGSTWIQAAKELSVRIEPNQTYGLVLAAFRLSHTFRTRNIYVYLLFLSGTAHSLQSSYCSVWRTEPNVRTVNARGAPSLIRCKRSKLNETYGPYERCLRFVTAFTVRTDLVRTVDQNCGP